uniref:Odorant-binding protein 12 n=2 Tax=Delia TaxID=30063 RepID=A0A0P0UVS9_9MUSC|nr:odorant-binding protein [Delia antiqua]BAS69451.1 odorant-binding protein 12 [Delia platura]
MKFFVVLAVLAISGYAVNAQDPIKLTEEQKLIVLQHAAECAKQTSASKEALQDLRAGKFSNVDNNTKCFTNCFLEKSGFLVDGQVQPAVVSKKLGSIVGADKINTIMAQCNGSKGANNCDTAFELFKCYYLKNAAIL